MSKLDRDEKLGRLDLAEYELLRQQILRRDGWRCQFCGTMSNLQVHHQQFRSQAGADVESNLITLCADCHSVIHRRGQFVVDKSWEWP